MNKSVKSDLLFVKLLNFFLKFITETLWVNSFVYLRRLTLNRIPNAGKKERKVKCREEQLKGKKVGKKVERAFLSSGTVQGHARPSFPTY